VLDVGCGTGAVVTRHVAAAGYRVVGIDTDEPSIAVARQAFRSALLEFRCGVLRDEQPGYDAVLLIEVLEHLTDPAALIADVARVLSPDGLLIVTVPNGFGPFEAEKALWRLMRMDQLWTRGIAPLLKRALRRDPAPAAQADVRNSLDESPHVNFFTRRRMRTLLASSGFDVQTMGKSSFIAGPFSDTFLPKYRWLINMNADIADVAPSWMVNGHYFVARRK
jgi:SAM-dependent methyltransferase